MASIELRRVSRAFNARFRALDEIDLTIDDGERLVFLGASGSGKTTILRLIAGLDRATSGSVLLGGVEADDLPPHRRNVAMVFQNPTLYPHLDVAGNLEFGLRARGVSRAERRRRIGEVAAILKIDSILHRRPASLSGGERQRVAIGRAVARRPAVLLLDEPFSSLDLPLRSALRRELVELHATFRTTLVHVTHDQAEALSLGRRVAVLDRGRLIQAAPPRELYHRPASPAVAAFVGTPPMNLLPCTLVREGAQTWIVLGDERRPIDDRLAPAVPGDGHSRSMVLGIRPEHLRIQLHADGLAFTSRIRRIEFQGDSVLLTIELAGSEAVARVAPSSVFHEDQPVGAAPELARASWFGV